MTIKYAIVGAGAMGREHIRNIEIIDEAEGNIEFLSLASRGEPLACPDITLMLKYTTGKFLNLKLNTNASLLNEEKCHAILAGGVRTVVFSADAADEKLYSKLRVNGKLSKVLKNIEQFQKMKNIAIANIESIEHSEQLDESVFNITESMSNAEKCKLLRKEYTRWNAQTNNANEKLRTRARKMVELAAASRKKYNC